MRLSQKIEESDSDGVKELTKAKMDSPVSNCQERAHCSRLARRGYASAEEKV